MAKFLIIDAQGNPDTLEFDPTAQGFSNLIWNEKKTGITGNNYQLDNSVIGSNILIVKNGAVLEDVEYSITTGNTVNLVDAAIPTDRFNHIYQANI